jgi:carbonyl reductase 1
LLLQLVISFCFFCEQKFKNEAVIKHLKENIDELDESTLDSIAEQYLEDIKSGTWKEKGWDQNFPQYSESKLFLNAYTRLLGKSLSERPDVQKILANVICPAFIATDMTNHNSMGQPVAAGADTPVWLALSPNGVANGKFFGERRD